MARGPGLVAQQRLNQLVLCCALLDCFCSTLLICCALQLEQNGRKQVYIGRFPSLPYTRKVLSRPSRQKAPTLHRNPCFGQPAAPLLLCLPIPYPYIPSQYPARSHAAIAATPGLEQGQYPECWSAPAARRTAGLCSKQASSAVQSQGPARRPWPRRPPRSLVPEAQGAASTWPQQHTGTALPGEGPWVTSHTTCCADAVLSVSFCRRCGMS